MNRLPTSAPTSPPNPSYPSQREGTSYSATDFSQSYQPPPSLQTHPILPKGQPILTFPKGRNKLPCFVKDFSKSIQPMNISPHLTSPEGEGQLLLLLIND